MALDFPASPADGAVYAGANGVMYQYSTARGLWLSVANAGQNLNSDFHATRASMPGFNAGVTQVITGYTVYSGNQNSYFNPTNGRFTPPAGRWLINASFSAYSSSSLLIAQVAILKNGTNIAGSLVQSVSPAAAHWTTPASQAVVSASGTDYFEMSGYTHVAASDNTARFTAVPVGLNTNATGDTFRLLSRQVAAGAVADFQFRNFPSDINDIRFSWDVVPATNASSLLLQIYDGTNTLIGANYAGAVTTGTHAQNGTAAAVMGSTATGITNSWPLDYGVATRRPSSAAGMSGEGSISNIRATANKWMRFQSGYLSDDNSLNMFCVGGGRLPSNQPLTGLRFSFSAGNIISGGTISVWGSP